MSRLNKSRQISSRLPRDVNSWAASNIFTPCVRSSTEENSSSFQTSNGTELLRHLVNQSPISWEGFIITLVPQFHLMSNNHFRLWKSSLSVKCVLVKEGWLAQQWNTSITMLNQTHEGLTNYSSHRRFQAYQLWLFTKSFMNRWESVLEHCI